MLRFLRNIIIQLICILEKNNKYYLPEYDDSDKIVDVLPISDIKVLTDTGYHDIMFLFKTKHYTIYNVEFENGLILDCADNHLVINEKNESVYIKDLKNGDYILSKYGKIKVINVLKTNNILPMCDITVNSYEHTFYSNNILSHNTTTSAIYILWYAIFNKDKNILMLGDIADTTKEIIDKVKNIYENLPFFMKPGLLINNVMSMKFDNGCRIIGRSTTKKSAIGLSINFLYMDEFAHINASFIDYFYRSVYPTISGTPNSKIVITSTPNGQNKFYDIWINAMEGKGDFHPMRIDWWQVEGRNEEWKQLTIENLGSIEDFNQEYGLQFFKGDNLLLNSSDLKKIDSIKQGFVSRKVDALYMNKTYYANNEKKTREVDLSEFLTWNKKFLQTTFTDKHSDLRADNNYYLLTIDTAKGVGKDHHVLNVWKITNLPKSLLLLNRNNINDVLDIFSCVQVGKFRCNNINIETFSDVVCNLVYNFFDTEKITVVLELNNQGVLVRDKLENHGRYWSGLLIHSKPNENAEFFEPGIDLSSNKRKVEFCEKFQHLVSIDRVIPTCKQTIQELANFGANEARTVYRSQTGNDDLAMTCVHTNAFFDSPQYYEICNELFDNITDKSYLATLEKDVIQYNMQRLESLSGASMLDFLQSSDF